MSPFLTQPIRYSRWPLLLAAALLLAAGWLQAADFTVRDARTRLVDGVYQLEADIRYQLSDPIHEALANGVPITIGLQIEIERQREYLWNKTVASLLQKYTVQFHALSEQYIVRNLNSGSQQSFRSLPAALQSMGEIEALPLLDESLLEETDALYQVQLRSHIDINALPAPLRPMAWLSHEWRLQSEWYVCPLSS